MNKLNKIKINTSVGIQCEENPVKKEKKKIENIYSNNHWNNYIQNR